MTTPGPDDQVRPARVLIVDDERKNRQLLEIMLSAEGFEISMAANAGEAYAMVAREPPDLILIDVMMQEIDGYQAVAQIKGDLATKNIPIIMVTALDDRDARMRALSAGAADFLSKPVDRAELCVRVRNLLRLKAYGEYYDQYSQMLANEVLERTADLIAQTKGLQAANASLEETNDRLKVEVAARERAEFDLRQAQKLEAVGILASGVAHEINTPIQFVSHSNTFVRDVIADLVPLLRKYQELRKAVTSGAPAETLASDLLVMEEAADLDYAMDNVRPALDRSLDGLGKVAEIVRSLKDFAHSGTAEMIPVDLNQAILTALILAKHEYKLVADVETSFATLPPVICHPGEINQVILNIVVNAAHAIASAVVGTSHRGTIKVRTTLEGDDVIVSIADTGAGIPLAIQDRIYDPFFTTKGVGKGTGQGLAISRTLVKRHGGTLTFDSVVGSGTAFHIRFPLQPRTAAAH